MIFFHKTWEDVFRSGCLLPFPSSHTPSQFYLLPLFLVKLSVQQNSMRFYDHFEKRTNNKTIATNSGRFVNLPGQHFVPTYFNMHLFQLFWYVSISEQRGSRGRCDGSRLFGHSEHEMVELKNFRAMRKKESIVATLEFRRANFSLFRELFSRVLWEPALEGLGVHKCCSVFGNYFLNTEAENSLGDKSS